MNKHGHDQIDLIKIDIEGSEYRVLNYILANEMNIKIICVEFDEMHLPLDNHFRSRIQKYVQLLGEKYECLKQDRSNFTFMRIHET